MKNNLQIIGRLSFPQIWRPKSFAATQPGQAPSEPKFSASVLIDKATGAAKIAEIRAAMKAVAEEKWGVGKVPKNVKYCLHDGDEKSDMDGYGPSVMYVSSSSAKKIPVVDKDLTPLDESSGKPYAGCTALLLVNLWAQDNQFGKRINAGLRAVQFIKDGEAFGEGAVDVQKELKPIEDDTSLE